MGEIWCESGRLTDGLKWSSLADRSPLASAYLGKEIRREGDKGTSCQRREKKLPLDESSTSNAA